MKWKANPAKEKIIPKLGDKKEKICFAFVPTKVQDSWLWLEKYIGIYEYQTFYWPREEVVSSGIFTEKVRTVPTEAQGWFKIDKKLL